MSQDIDSSRARRAFRMSKLGAKLALAQGRRLFARDEAAVHRELAEALADELGKLKGLPMKIGQILSYMDGVVPPEQEAIYQSILGRLRTSSIAIDEASWRGVIHEELGMAPEKAFDEFDPEPIARASIGQVHAAMFEGERVCVKVQYPEIVRATEADLENMEAIVAIVRRVMPSVDTRQMIQDFRDRLAEECDYRIEASHQRRFAAIYENDPDLLVPRVIDARSTQRVLTTRRIGGVSLEAFVASSSQAERDRAGVALFRFAFGTLLQHGLFHADPHPGNLLFMADDDGRLGVLDYGCVQPIDDEARRDLSALISAARAGRDLREPARRGLGIGAIDDESADAMVEIVRLVLAPILEPQPYRFTRRFASDITRAVTDAKMRLGPRYLSRRGSFEIERPGVMFVVRNLFGLATIWGQLEARADFRAIVDEMLAVQPDRVSPRL
ncbi:MAG: ABC1 kinase family protein [Sandaracinaceae bacterium]